MQLSDIDKAVLNLDLQLPGARSLGDFRDMGGAMKVREFDHRYLWLPRVIDGDWTCRLEIHHPGLFGRDARFWG